jgi:HEPN domain-containing protein
MTNLSLAESYLAKGRARLKVLALLMAEADYSDVVREAQEVVELALKGMLRQVGVEPPKVHDVGSHLREHAARFPASVQTEIPKLMAASTWLRKERELAFCGEVDAVPTEEYDESDARRAMDAATFVVRIAAMVIVPPVPER